MRMGKRVERRTGKQKLDVQVPSKHVFDWNTIHCRLLWYYKGPPNTQSGTFETVNFIIWRLVRGCVEVATDDDRVHAKAGEWVIMAHTLGRRRQEFTPDARIESLHLSIDTRAAKLTAPSIVVLPGNAALGRATAELGRQVLHRSRAGLTPEDHVFMSQSFLEQIELKKLLWSYLAVLVPLLSKAGMMFCEPDYSDPRVAVSISLIDNWPPNLAWDRKRISRAAGVSASQLDRIWRETRGETPFQYWNSRRIRFACDRLENSDCSIKEIAYDLGFRHLAQFSTWFHSRLNTSPREHRRAFTG